MRPDAISLRFHKDSTVPIAAVCLKDCVHLLIQARWALAQSYASLDWFRGKSPFSREGTAVFFGRFYADDVAVRLYAAQEHLADAIIAMLEITKTDLNPHQNKRVSKASVVGAFMRKQKPNHKITKAAVKLFSSAAWKDADRYRGLWTHEQPPAVANSGQVWTRDKRWKKVQQTGVEAYSLGIGTGDPPEYTVDQIVKFLHAAFAGFASTVRTVVNAYLQILKVQGIQVNRSNKAVNWSFQVF
jgi:hypothetical protein